MNVMYGNLTKELMAATIRMSVSLLAMPGFFMVEVLAAIINQGRSKTIWKGSGVILMACAYIVLVKILEVMIDGMVDVVAEGIRSVWRIIRVLSIMEVVACLLAACFISAKTILSDGLGFFYTLVLSIGIGVAVHYSFLGIKTEMRRSMGDNFQVLPFLSRYGDANLSSKKIEIGEHTPQEYFFIKNSSNCLLTFG